MSADQACTNPNQPLAQNSCGRSRQRSKPLLNPHCSGPPLSRDFFLVLAIVLPQPPMSATCTHRRQVAKCFFFRCLAISPLAVFAVMTSKYDSGVSLIEYCPLLPKGCSVAKCFFSTCAWCRIFLRQFYPSRLLARCPVAAPSARRLTAQRPGIAIASMHQSRRPVPRVSQPPGECPVSQRPSRCAQSLRPVALASR